MFKIKFPLQDKEIIKQTLGIMESDDYDIVLCHDIKDQETEKINIVFQLSNLDIIKEKIQFFKNVSPIYLYGKTTRGEVKIDINDIIYIESFGNEVIAYSDQKEINLSLRLYELIDKLCAFGFIRIGKSIIVNITKVIAVNSAINGKLTITLSNDRILEVNRSYKKAFKAYLKGK